MRVSILNIGNELLRGSTLNGNLSLIGQKLLSLGVEADLQITVPDKPAKIANALRILSSESGLIISTGGLGPTSDDLTKQTIAEFFSLRLVYSKKIEEKIRSFWRKRRKGKIPQSVFSQAYIIEGTEVIDNDFGTAPGFIIRDKKRSVVMMVLPGPPSEAIPMLDAKIAKIIDEMNFPRSYLRTFFSFGLPESIVEEITKKTIPDSKIELAYCASIDGTRIYLKSDNLSKLEIYTKKLQNNLGDYILSKNAKNIFEEILLILKERSEKISIAESCTGGLISKRITDIPGSSEVFLGGIVSYANFAKEKLLSVKKFTLQKYGAVSCQTAKEMLKAVKLLFDSEAAISVTGIAGPQGGTKSKPVGLVFIGATYKNKSQISKYIFTGSRGQIREKAAVSAMNQLKKLINRNKQVL